MSKEAKIIMIDGSLNGLNIKPFYLKLQNGEYVVCDRFHLNKTIYDKYEIINGFSKNTDISNKTIYFTRKDILQYIILENGNMIALLHNDSTIELIQPNFLICCTIKLLPKLENNYSRRRMVSHNDNNLLIIYDYTNDMSNMKIHIINLNLLTNPTIHTITTHQKKWRGIFENFIFLQETNHHIEKYDLLNQTCCTFNVDYNLKCVGAEKTSFNENNYEYTMDSKEYIKNISINKNDILQLPIYKWQNDYKKIIYHKIYDETKSYIKYTLAEVLGNDDICMHICDGDSNDISQFKFLTSVISLQEGGYCIYKNIIYLVDGGCGSEGLCVYDPANEYVGYYSTCNLPEIAYMKTWNGKLINYDYYSGKFEIIDVDIKYNIKSKIE